MGKSISEQADIYADEIQKTMSTNGQIAPKRQPMIGPELVHPTRFAETFVNCSSGTPRRTEPSVPTLVTIRQKDGDAEIGTKRQ
jgi:hypothetical protein